MATTATGFVGGITSLILCRLLLDVGKAFFYPVNTKLTALWFRRSERGLATGIWASGSRRLRTHPAAGGLCYAAFGMARVAPVLPRPSQSPVRQPG